MKSYVDHSTHTSANTLVRCFLFWCFFLLLLYATGPITPLFPLPWTRFMFGVFGTLSAILLTWLFLKQENKSYASIGWAWESRTILRFFKGLLLGSALFLLMLLALVGLTELQIHPNTKAIHFPAIMGYLAILPLAMMEEMAFRSYPFLRLQRRIGLRIAQVIVALAFALYHVVGGQSVFSSFVGPGVWAFVFGLAAAWSGGIAMPFGIHVALNVLQPLTGLRGDTQSLWVLNYKDGVSPEAMARTETVGLVLHSILLVGAVGLTEYFIRYKRNREPHTAAKDHRLVEKIVVEPQD